MAEQEPQYEGQPPSRWRFLELFIQFLILVSIVCFTVETLPALSERTQEWLRALEVIIVAAFTIEYGCRLLFAENRLRFAFSFFGLIDLISIAPFYLALGLDLRAIRVLRVFRVFRMFKMLRYTRAAERFKAAFVSMREEFALYLLSAGVIVYLCSVGIYYFEGEAQPKQFGSVLHCLWWAIVTLTTVGYGDAVPVTPGGRLFTGLILMVGIGLVAVPAGLFASAMTKTRQQ